MGALLTSTSAERQQALQQLQSTFGQPNGDMVFTYNGSVYQTLSVNSDGTLRVLNQTTNQITYSLDPVEVYAEARVASGNPLPPPPPPPPAPQPGVMQNIMAQAGQYIGFANLLEQSLGAWATGANAIQKPLMNGTVQSGISRHELPRHNLGEYHSQQFLPQNSPGSCRRCAWHL